MKLLPWLSACILFAVLVAVESWPALRDLSMNREWRTVAVSTNSASMKGMQLKVETQLAAISAQKPDRAAVFVRLQMLVTPAVRDEWKDCRVSLHGSAGRVWMPVTNASADGAIKLLSPDGKNHGMCRLFSRTGPDDTETVQADQLFLVPTDSMRDLRLHVSGAGTRPHALSFAIAPAVRQFP